jgi:hypothetical protein
MSSGSTPRTVTKATTEPRGQNRNLKTTNKMDEELKNAKAYAKRLEEIIQAVSVDTNTRLILNMLVGEAKQKYNMYNL